MWRWPVADLMERPLEELKQGWIKVTLLMGSTEASEEEMTANAIWRGSESQAISSMVTAIQEMSRVRGHLYWTEGGFSWSIEEDMVAKTLALLYWGWRCLSLLSASSARWCLFTVLSTLQTVLLTNIIFMWVRVGWARFWVWHDVEVAWEDIGGAGAGVNKGHFGG